MTSFANLRVLSILLIAFAVTGSDLVSQLASAQEGRLFGGGRFIRRIRSEINNAGKPKKADKEKAKKNAKAPTPASKPKQASPFDSRRNPFAKATNRQPTPATRGTNRPQPNQFDAAARRLTAKPQPSPSEPPNARITRSAAKPTLGFGMLIQERNDQLVVMQIDPKGNASEAGIRAGDVIVKGGGVEFQNVSEFNEISDILKDGDQLEFEIKRRGKDEKTLITYGKAPEDSEILADAKAPGQPFQADRVNTRDNYDFVPSTKQQVGSGLKSVLDAPSRENTSSRATRSPQTQTRPRTISPQVQQTLLRQQQEIERLRRELQRRQSRSSGSPNNGLSLTGADS